MAEIFLSYQRSDRDKVVPIIALLENDQKIERLCPDYITLQAQASRSPKRGANSLIGGG